MICEIYNRELKFTTKIYNFLFNKSKKFNPENNVTLNDFVFSKFIFLLIICVGIIFKICFVLKKLFGSTYEKIDNNFKKLGNTTFYCKKGE